MNKIALITGATSGIGKATALCLAKEGFDVILTGRRIERLNQLVKEIEQVHKVRVKILCFDVTKYSDVERAIGSLSSDWLDIDVLVNNAGLAVGLNPIHEGVIEDWERMIDTNIKGLLYVTRLVSPLMVQRKTGHIINLSSIAGKHVYPNGNVYCATKHAASALSQAMRLDLLPYNIRVTQVCPGAAETEFSNVRFKGDRTRADQVYDGYIALSADNIAEAICYAVMQPPHVTLQDILIMPTAQATGNTFYKKQE